MNVTVDATGMVLLMSQLVSQSGGLVSMSLDGLVTAGPVTIAVTLAGAPLPVFPNATVMVRYNPAVSAARSLVSGTGAGVPVTDDGSSTGDMETVLVAGQQYKLVATAYDQYGNRHTDDSPGFQLVPSE